MMIRYLKPVRLEGRYLERMEALEQFPLVASVEKHYMQVKKATTMKCHVFKVLALSAPFSHVISRPTSGDRT